MEKFNISYKYEFSDEFDDWFYMYLNGLCGFNNEFLARDEEEKNFFTEMNEYKKIIKNDLRLICVNMEKYQNAEGLIQKLNTIREIFNENFSGAYNFLTLTDQYLCFNCYEEEIDYEDAITYSWMEQDNPFLYSHENIVIISKDMKKFYFIEKGREIWDKKIIYVKTTTFEVVGTEIQSKITYCRKNFPFDHSKDDEIKKMLNRYYKKIARNF